MNKQEFILELTKKFSPNNNQYYNNAIVDAIILAHKLDEPIQLPFDAARLGEYAIHLIEQNFRYKVDRSTVLTLSTLILDGNKLHAVKLYKEMAEIGLKEAKEDVDIVMAKLAAVQKK